MGMFLRLATKHNALKAYEFDQEQWSAANQVPSDLAEGVCAALVCIWMAVYQHQAKPFHFRKDTKTLVKHNWLPLTVDVAYAAESDPTMLASYAFTYSEHLPTP